MAGLIPWHSARQPKPFHIHFAYSTRSCSWDPNRSRWTGSNFTRMVKEIWSALSLAEARTTPNPAWQKQAFQPPSCNPDFRNIAQRSIDSEHNTTTYGGTTTRLQLCLFSRTNCGVQFVVEATTSARWAVTIHIHHYNRPRIRIGGMAPNKTVQWKWGISTNSTEPINESRLPAPIPSPTAGADTEKKEKWSRKIKNEWRSVNAIEKPRETGTGRDRRNILWTVEPATLYLWSPVQLPPPTCQTFH